MARPRLLIFASGTSEGGGSGFENLVLKAREGVLQADIAGVVSNHVRGGVRKRADRLSVPFHHFPAPWTAERYAELVAATKAEYCSLSGWLKKVSGLDPRRTINIHPGPLPEFGGEGMYGRHVHEAVLRAFRDGTLSHSAVTMHFVASEYDRGAPVFFRLRVRIREDDTVESLAARVNALEHRWQPEITNLVLDGSIAWDGSRLDSLRCPPAYKIERDET